MYPTANQEKPMDKYWKQWEVEEAFVIERVDQERLTESVEDQYNRRLAKLLSQGDIKGIRHLCANSDLVAIVGRIAA